MTANNRPTKANDKPAAYLVTLADCTELCQPGRIGRVVTSMQLLGISVLQLAGQLKTDTEPWGSAPQSWIPFYISALALGPYTG